MIERNLEFSWKYEDYELRACPKCLARFNDDEPNETIDFVKWTTDSSGKRYCFSLAYWRRYDEGYELKFVGGRPFDHINKEHIEVVWSALLAAQKILDAWFDMQYIEE